MLRLANRSNDSNIFISRCNQMWFSFTAKFVCEKPSLVYLFGDSYGELIFRDFFICFTFFFFISENIYYSEFQPRCLLVSCGL